MKAPSPIALGVAVGVLLLHLGAAFVALVFLPHGFPLTSLHLWSNTALPALAVLTIVGVLVRYAFRPSSPLAVTLLLAAAAGGWTFAVVLGAVLFPISVPLARCVVPGGVALWLLVVARWAALRAALSLAALAVGGAVGVLVTQAQRAPEPSTRPSGGTLAEVQGPATSDEAATGQLIVACGKGKLRLNPLLTFQSRSPDRTWVLLAPSGEIGQRRAMSHYTKTANGFRATCTDDGESSLVVTRDKTGLIDIEAITVLRAPVYSHLNTWTAVHVMFDATVAFGPTGTTRFPIEPADYPSGRPTQLAYLGEDLAFRVVRARDAEKGPFNELAKGRLTRDETLTMEIRPRDEKDKGCRLVFKDWSAQVSTDASPTAGWGVPANSIQFFSRDGEGVVFLALAETGPGRGYDSVGHAAGTYRNRLHVEAIR